VTLGRQVRNWKEGKSLPDRHAGPGPPAPMMQRQRDLAAGPQTPQATSRAIAASPLGRPSNQAAVAGQALHQEQPHRIPARRQRGTSAATAPVWAPKQIHLYPGARATTAVFGHVVRPKGRGVRPFRAMSSRHPQFMPGTSRHGRHRGTGPGDDHMAKSVDDGPPERAGSDGGPASPVDPIPRRRPGNILDFGPAMAFANVALLGACGVASRWLSGARRFSSASVPCRPAPPSRSTPPTDFILPADARAYPLARRLGWGQERRGHPRVKQPAALGLTGAPNKLDPGLMMDGPECALRASSPSARSIPSTVCQALDELGIDDAEARTAGPRRLQGGPGCGRSRPRGRFGLRLRASARSLVVERKKAPAA